VSKLMSAAAVVVGLAVGLSPAQEPPRTPTAPAAGPVKRAVYAVRYGSAAELATALGQHFQGEPGFRSVAAATSNTLLLSGPPEVLAEALQTLDQLDRKPRTFVVEVFFADAPAGAAGQPGEAGLDPKALSGPADDVAARLEGLKQQGRLAGLRRVRVAAVEGQHAAVNSGEEVSVVMSSQPAVGPGGRGGGFSANVTRRNVGTLVEVLPRVAPDGLVQLELKVEDSRATPTEGGADGGPPPGVITITTVKGTVSVRAGQAVIASGVGDGGTTRRQTAIVVAVRPAKPGNARSK
jgi:type II secretory pathway component GspD/PulD (secretin)